MACIQLVAAHISEIDKLVFHTYMPSFTEAYPLTLCHFSALFDK